MSETITLPKSGIVLTGEPRNGYSNERIPFAWLCINDESDGSWFAQSGLSDNDFYGTRDECVAWLDGQLLARRAALLPADALARALKSVECRMDEGTTDDGFQYLAKRVLAALGGQP